MVRPKNQMIWQHFRQAEDKSVTCKHCEKQYKVATLQKMGRHLLNCINCPETAKQQLRTGSSRSATSDVLPLGSIENIMPAEFNDSVVNTSSSSTARQSDVSNEDLHKLLAKAIYVSGSPLSMVEHPLWVYFFLINCSLYTNYPREKLFRQAFWTKRTRICAGS